MGGPYKRKKYHYGDTHLKKNWRTKRMTRHLDQIDSDLAPENAKKLLSQPVDLDKSGNAQFYCVHCAKYMIDQRAFQVLFKRGHTIRKVKFLSENSILSKLYNFHVTSKLSTTKKCKSPTFSRVFAQIFFDNFSREIKVVNS